MGGRSSAEADRIGRGLEEETIDGLFCWPRYLDGRDAHLRSRSRGRCYLWGKTASTAEAIAGELAKAPSCRRIVFETGRMAPILFHGLSQLGLPVVCIESRRLIRRSSRLRPTRPIATTRAARASGSHRLLQGRAREVFVSPRRPLAHHRAQEAGRAAGDPGNQMRGLAVVFGVRLPRALTAAFIDKALKASEGIAGLSAAMRGLIAARTAVMTAVAAIDADIRRMTTASEACRRLMAIPASAN